MPQIVCGSLRQHVKIGIQFLTLIFYINSCAQLATLTLELGNNAVIFKRERN